MGEYISFVDSDDWIEPDYVEKLKSQVGDAEIMFFDGIWSYEDGSSVIYAACPSYSKTSETSEKAVLHLLENDTSNNLFGFTWNKVFRLDVIKNHGIRFIPDLCLWEDDLFTLSYCQKISRLRILSDAHIYHYRVTRKGLTGTNAKSAQYLLFSKELHSLLKGCSNQRLASVERGRVVAAVYYSMMQSKSPRQYMKGLKWLYALYQSNDFELSKYEFAKTAVCSILHHKS